VSEVVLVSIYLFVLAAFVGLDVISKVPPAAYGLMVAVLGLLTAFGAIGLVGPVAASLEGNTGQLAAAGTVLGGVALGAGMSSLEKVLGAFRKGPHP
jgi:hypothetical protein